MNYKKNQSTKIFLNGGIFILGISLLMFVVFDLKNIVACLLKILNL